MANIEITNNDLNSAIYSDIKFRDDSLTFAAAGTVLAGTILARDSGTGKLIPFVKGGVTAENGIPKAILTYAVTATASGDVAVRAAVSGNFRKEKLVIDADGNASNIDSVVIDQLRDYGLVALDVQNLSVLDNQ